MNTKPIKLLQERDFSQKMNASFEFAKQNFKPLVRSLLLIAGPAALVSGIAQGLFQSRLLGFPKDAGPLSLLSQYLTFEYALSIAFSFVTLFLSNATVSAYMVIYEEKGPFVEITPGDVWRKIQENILSSTVAMILSFILAIIGMFFFLIPGIYLGVALQFYMMIIIREKLSAVDSLKRSHKLIYDKWWSSFGILVIMSIVAGIFSLVFQLPILITTALSSLGIGKEFAGLKGWLVAGNALSIVGYSVVQGLVWIALGFQYYNLVERQSGSGLLSEIDTLGSGNWERPAAEENY